ncbi:MAG: hypothetical protein V1815_03120 [Candidatus Woesearchaeota archaeon]
MNKKLLITYIISIIVLIFLAFYSYLNKTGWFKEIIVTIIVITLFLLTSKKTHITPLIFSLLCLDLILNAFGTFGFYYKSPFPFGYDKLTHFFGFFSFSLFSYNYLANKKINLSKIMVLILVFLISQGLGSLMEISEYYSATLSNVSNINSAALAGPTFGTSDYDINIIGPDPWINTMQDLIFNGLGSLTAIFLIFSYKKFKNLRK